MDNEPYVVLESERLLFRKHIMADMDAYCAMEMDAAVRRYVGGRPRTREEAERRFMNTIGPATGKLGMWASVYKPENKYIGRCGIYPHFGDDDRPIPGEASLGLYIASGYWNRGFATEAARAFISLGFNDLKLDRIVTMVQVGNDASVHVLQKLGFEIIRTETGDVRSFYHLQLENKN